MVLCNGASLYIPTKKSMLRYMFLNRILSFCMSNPVPGHKFTLVIRRYKPSSKVLKTSFGYMFYLCMALIY